MKHCSACCTASVVVLSVSLLFGLCTSASAEPPSTAGGVHAYPLLSVQPAPYFDLWYGDWPCYLYGPCVSYQQFKAWERRRERARELARLAQPPPPIGIEAWHGWPGNAVRRMPQGDSAHAKPQYGDVGRVKEPFQSSGEFLPEFLDGRVRPR